MCIKKKLKNNYFLFNFNDNKNLLSNYSITTVFLLFQLKN